MFNERSGQSGRLDTTLILGAKNIRIVLNCKEKNHYLLNQFSATALKWLFEYRSKELDDPDAIYEGKTHTCACAQIREITKPILIP
jgi:hypothetical protein